MSLDNYNKISDDEITIYLPKEKVEVDKNFITSESNFEFNQNEINHLKEHFEKNYNGISNTFLLPIDSLYRILKKEEKAYSEYIEVCWNWCLNINLAKIRALIIMKENLAENINEFEKLEKYIISENINNSVELIEKTTEQELKDINKANLLSKKIKNGEI